MVKTIKKATGSFYTCCSVADYIVNWAIRNKNDVILEPSFGDGAFLYSAINKFTELDEYNPVIYGVEVQQEVFSAFMVDNTIVKGEPIDFFDYKAEEPIDVVIGNPPYISLKNISEKNRKNAISLMHKYNVNMPTSSSLWMPFIIHSTEMLKQGGRIGFVLPYEITYVRYAFHLWEYLGNNFGKISIYRIYNDFFPDVDVETVVFLAERKGEKTNNIEYKIFNDISEVFDNTPVSSSSIPILDIFSLKKPFERELLPIKAKKLIDRLRNNQQLSVLIRDCKFKIGYVSGNKSYFHPSKQVIDDYHLKNQNLLPCMLNAKEIGKQSNMGLQTLGAEINNYLFYPQYIGEGEKAYIAFGESQKVHEGYKCKVRNPWYITPTIETPDIILTVFGDTPRIIVNNGNFIVSNSLLCGKINNDSIVSSKEIICRWYNSLTLLMIELYIHSLGGGTLVIIPGEMDKMELISNFPTDKIDDVFEQLNKSMIEKGLISTYNLGDTIVLKKLYGFSDSDISEIRTALGILRSWRNPENRRL